MDHFWADVEPCTTVWELVIWSVWVDAQTYTIRQLSEEVSCKKDQ